MKERIGWFWFERRIENGEWRMENGEWRMENGEWRMENGEWRIDRYVSKWSRYYLPLGRCCSEGLALFLLKESHKLVYSA
jgi:hypothetical protein